MNAKKTKRILAILLAVMFALSVFPMTALANDPFDDGVEGEGAGSGLWPDVSYAQKTVALIPTSLGFDFILDPQGLYNLTDEEIEDSAICLETRRLGVLGAGDVWEPHPEAGQIIFAHYAPYFINMSNHETILEIEFSFTDGKTVADVIAIDDPDDVNCVGDDCACGHCEPDDDPLALVFIGATFSTGVVDEIPDDFAGTLGLPILDTVQTPLFIFKGAEYTHEIKVERGPDGMPTVVDVEMLKELADDATGFGTQFMLTGFCNPNANWGPIFIDPDIELAIEVIFSLTTPDEPLTGLGGWEFTVDELAALLDEGASGEIDDRDDLDDWLIITGIYGLYLANDLEASDFVPLAKTWTAPPPPGFLIDDDIIFGTLTDATMEDEPGVVLVPFRFATSILAGVSLYSMGSHNDMTAFAERVAGGVEIDFTGWPEDDYEITIWLDAGTPFKIVITLVEDI
jgi:hypothetical protein